MLKRIVTIALTAVLAAAFLTSCGSSKSTTTPATGSLTSLVSDTPGLCDAVSFPFSVTHLYFIGYTLSGSGPGGGAGGGAATTPINPGIASPPEIKINLGCLRDFTTVLNISPANIGTYDLAFITLSEPQLIFYDPTILPPNPPVNNAQLTLSPLTVIQIPVSPPLVINKDQASVIQIDFDMRDMIQSITTDPTTGKLIVTGTPEITFTPITASGSQGQGFGELDDLVGFVRSVTILPPGNTSLYNGSFALQLLSASITGPPLVTVNLNSSSQLYGFSDLNQLVTDSFMEVDAYIDIDGNFVATSVEDEYTEVPSSNTLALIGPVTSVTRNGSGNVTSFNLWMRDVEPNTPSTATPDTICVVNVTASTTYQYSSRSANFANLPFGPGNIAVGQEVVVHGQVTPPTGVSGAGAPSLTSTVAAAKVYNKLQTIQGSFSSLVQVGKDDKTGAFVFTPCPTLFQGTPTMVLTSNQTAFVNLSGLSSLSGPPNQPALLVKGLPFFEAQAQTINGVPVPAGTLVIVAKQVHQL
ncbi:MAG: hypothetical protein WBO19_08540 [Terriglobia bacterium]|jgi:hypothetical protein